MKIALSTNWCCGRTACGEEIADTAAELGFSALELGYNATRSEVEGIMRRGFPVESVHAFCPVPLSAPCGYPELYLLASTDEPGRALARAFVSRNIEFAASVGARTMVLHAGRVSFSSFWKKMSSETLRKKFRESRSDAASPGYAGLLEKAKKARRKSGSRMLDIFKGEIELLLPQLEKSRITLALENLPYLEGFPDEEELGVLVSFFSSPYVRGWFDTGHDMVRRTYGWSRAFLPDPEIYAGMHINDVEGPADDHFAPGFGKIDFSQFRDFAEKTGHVVFEPSPSVSMEDLKKGIENYERQMQS